MRPPILLLAGLLLVAAPAGAQTPPRHFALAGSNGVLLPAAPYGPASLFTGLLEVGLSPRVALRPSLFWAEPAISGEDLSLRRVGLGWDVVIRWDHGGWQPYLVTGATLQLFRPKLGGRPIHTDDELNFGMAFGGGLEFFVAAAKSTAITAEVTAFLVERGRLATSPSGGAFRVGLKQYF